MSKPDSSGARAAQAVILAWVLPGAGHYLLGHRALAAVYFATITLTFWTGIAVGGVKETTGGFGSYATTDPRFNKWQLLASVGVGGYQGVCVLVGRSLPNAAPGEPSPYVSYFPEAEIGQIYVAVASLLNVMAILDAVSRAQNRGEPVFHHELAPREAAS